ncbi:hydroxysqualene dehydroxylase HpnE [Pseudorhodoferax sp. Leaf274]|uniref:hydroxysqualene dehydroxylase HpnE n=1 Tax=Pseudorhodoferax sp. Leaf274 TaxID=1736318 RepID=UPI000702CC60|nr:hydroxysqualene dehydroxylase HpnE [Pseudorhodoferax sp. Leaf274]KQP49284.1 desaturase [Pseudorhodoferax sp. Leaf274]
MKLAIVGAGWAGLAAAVRATEAGHQVTVFESARHAGGRARSVVHDHAGRALTLDNGQHILIGAYTETLALMRSVGVDPDQALLRLPLDLRLADGSGIALPDRAPPWDALAGILGARGWGWRDKATLLAATTRWQLAGFRCAPQASVAQLCTGLTARVQQQFVEPLCLSALNTCADEASASVFLRVLRDSLLGGRGGSNLLVPRRPLGALFPAPAMAWLQARGQPVQLGTRVAALQQDGRAWRVDGQAFDRVLLACPSWEAARLVRTADRATTSAARSWLACADALRFEPITTVYATSATRLPRPMTALAGGPAQFVFDRRHLGEDGLLAFVVSVSRGTREELQQQVIAQGRAQLARFGLGDLQPVVTIVEKRATFACTPGLQRPGLQVAPGLSACGEYVAGPYPGTIEGAVRSALQALA